MSEQETHPGNNPPSDEIPMTAVEGGRVHQRLPAAVVEAEPSRVIETLRSEVDPSEHWSPAWILKLKRAAVYFEAERAVSSRRRGASATTAARIADAAALKRTGIASVEIARKMGVTPARVSQWLKDPRAAIVAP